ncbi:MAG TPA: DUF5700 domain-containing putative Zn-dependent protease [Holophagaceae bacterium]|nr:DUF5700 domain-containing putative Zn-dependent protease [Holophagaceae bacterium]
MAVLALLDLQSQGRTPTDGDWAQLFATEGYRRLKRREAAIQRPFEDADFKAFVRSEALLMRAPALHKALDEWRKLDPSAAAGRALTYLPTGARIRATIYPVIKPKSNSFVFEMETDPAIFVFVDPERNAAQEQNTLTHELHHIGYDTLQPARTEAGLSEAQKLASQWTGAFGEGFAMLAAAGGPSVHPHAVSPAADRDRWDRDMDRFPEDFLRVASFFQRILDGSLQGEAATKEAVSFYGIQGPWYTVGWRMAALIETRLGKARLMSVFQDLPTLYRTWNEASEAEEKAGGPKLPRWPEGLVRAMEGGAAPKP